MIPLLQALILKMGFDKTMTIGLGQLTVTDPSTKPRTGSSTDPSTEPPTEPSTEPYTDPY